MEVSELFQSLVRVILITWFDPSGTFYCTPFDMAMSSATKAVSNITHCKFLSSDNERSWPHIPHHQNPTPMTSAGGDAVVQCIILRGCAVLRGDINVAGRTSGNRKEVLTKDRQFCWVKGGGFAGGFFYLLFCFLIVLWWLLLLALARRAVWRRRDNGGLKNNERSLSQTVIEIQGTEKQE